MKDLLKEWNELSIKKSWIVPIRLVVETVKALAKPKPEPCAWLITAANGAQFLNFTKLPQEFFEKVGLKDQVPLYAEFNAPMPDPVAVIVEHPAYNLLGEPRYNELEELIDIQELPVGTRLYSSYPYEGIRVTVKEREGDWIEATNSSPAPTNATIILDPGVVL